MFDDKRGLPMTASSQAAVDAFDACVDAFLASGRDAGLLLLPRNAAWAPAPDALVEIMAGVEPPPLPTKP